jgi:hypothetical protein
MVAYNFDKVANIAKYSHDGTTTVTAQFELTAELTTADTISGVPVPGEAVITDIKLITTELDTDASPTLTLNVGDATDPDRFIAVATTGDAVNTTSANVTSIVSNVIDTGLGYEYAAEDSLVVDVAANAATGATTGHVILVVTYTTDAQ